MSVIPATNIYTVKPLPSPASDIRLLKLQKSNEPGIISCSLEICSLDDNPVYIAGSYEWGEADDNLDIWMRIDGNLKKIRFNLWIFLFRMTNTTFNNQAFWFDAICINQNDTVEKSLQVALMGRIYRQAYSVIAWLGCSTSTDPRMTVKFIERAAITQPSTAKLQDWLKKFTSEDFGRIYYEKFSLADQWQQVLKLLTLSYWSRRWVIQELILARDIVILYDYEEVSWGALKHLFSLLDALPRRDLDENLFFSKLRHTTAWKIWQYRSLPSKHVDLNNRIDSLGSLLSDFKDTLCELPHDRIYAFLSLTKANSSIKIDYRATPEELMALLISPITYRQFPAYGIVEIAQQLEISNQPIASIGGMIDPLIIYQREDNQERNFTTVRRVIHSLSNQDRRNSRFYARFDNIARYFLPDSIQKRYPADADRFLITQSSLWSQSSSRVFSSRGAFITCGDKTVALCANNVRETDLLHPLTEEYGIVYRYFNMRVGYGPVSVARIFGAFHKIEHPSTEAFEHWALETTLNTPKYVQNQLLLTWQGGRIFYTGSRVLDLDDMGGVLQPGSCFPSNSRIQLSVSQVANLARRIVDLDGLGWI